MYKYLVLALLVAFYSANAFAQSTLPVVARDYPPLSGYLLNDIAAVQPVVTERCSEGAMFENAVSAQKKSTGLAALYSLVLPGAGEMYVGGIDAGKYPLIAEAALWLTWGTMQYYGGWLQDDARRFAVVHAGVASTTADDLFYVNVSNFSNTYEYNEKKLIDRSLELVYSSSATTWQWDSEANRQQFRNQRVMSDRVFNNARFVIGGMLVNRIVSAINAARVARQFNRSVESGTGAWRIESSMTGPNGVQVALVRTF